MNLKKLKIKKSISLKSFKKKSNQNDTFLSEGNEVRRDRNYYYVPMTSAHDYYLKHLRIGPDEHRVHYSEVDEICNKNKCGYKITPVERNPGEFVISIYGLEKNVEICIRQINQLMSKEDYGNIP